METVHPVQQSIRHPLADLQVNEVERGWLEVALPPPMPVKHISHPVGRYGALSRRTLASIKGLLVLTPVSK